MMAVHEEREYHITIRLDVNTLALPLRLMLVCTAHMLFMWMWCFGSRGAVKTECSH